jgi:hypothetical protein
MDANMSPAGVLKNKIADSLSAREFNQFLLPATRKRHFCFLDLLRFSLFCAILSDNLADSLTDLPLPYMSVTN